MVEQSDENKITHVSINLLRNFSQLLIMMVKFLVEAPHPSNAQFLTKILFVSPGGRIMAGYLVDEQKLVITS